MRLPNRENAQVPESKLTGYLLSETHPDGKSKAAYLRSVGFGKLDVSALRQELTAIAQSYEVHEIMRSPFGTKYVVDGDLTAPDGTRTRVRTIWIIETDDSIPRFITAYPT